MTGKARSQRGGGNGRRTRGGGRSRSKRPATNRRFPRTARLNTLLHEIVADFFERVDDDRFEMLTVTGVEVDNDLNRAQVFVSTLGSVSPSTPAAPGADVPPAGSDPDRELLDALADYRKPVRAKIGREARIRKTPEVVFAIDPAVRSGARIDEILAAINPGGSDSEVPADDAAPARGGVDGHDGDGPDLDNGHGPDLDHDSELDDSDTGG